MFWLKRHPHLCKKIQESEKKLFLSHIELSADWYLVVEDLGTFRIRISFLHLVTVYILYVKNPKVRIENHSKFTFFCILGNLSQRVTSGMISDFLVKIFITKEIVYIVDIVFSEIYSWHRYKKADKKKEKVKKSETSSISLFMPLLPP